MQLKEQGFRVNAIEPQAAIYLTVQFDLVNQSTQQGLKLKDQDDVTNFLLNQAALAVVPFYAFGAPRDSSWYRLSVGTSKKEEIGAMISQLRQALKTLDNNNA